MSLDNPFEGYYEPFWLQAWLPKDDGFGGVIWGWSDGLRTMGVFVPRNEAEVRIAEAQGLAVQGDYVTDIRMELKPRDDVLRRESDNKYFRITGLPEKSPAPAISKFQRVAAEMVEQR